MRVSVKTLQNWEQYRRNDCLIRSGRHGQEVWYQPSRREGNEKKKGGTFGSASCFPAVKNDQFLFSS